MAGHRDLVRRTFTKEKKRKPQPGDRSGSCPRDSQVFLEIIYLPVGPGAPVTKVLDAVL